MMPDSILLSIPNGNISCLNAKAISKSLPPIRWPLCANRLAVRSALPRQDGPIWIKEQSVVPPPISTTRMVLSSVSVASYSRPAATGSNWNSMFWKPARFAALRRMPSAWMFAVSPPRPWKLIGRPITASVMICCALFSACALMLSIMAQTRSSKKLSWTSRRPEAPRKDFGDFT